MRALTELRSPLGPSTGIPTRLSASKFITASFSSGSGTERSFLRVNNAGQILATVTDGLISVEFVVMMDRLLLLLLLLLFAGCELTGEFYNASFMRSLEMQGDHSEEIGYSRPDPSKKIILQLNNSYGLRQLP